MRGVGVGVVDVVGMTRTLGPRVAAGGPVLVDMGSVNGVLGGH